MYWLRPVYFQAFEYHIWAWVLRQSFNLTMPVAITLLQSPLARHQFVLTIPQVSFVHSTFFSLAFFHSFHVRLVEDKHANEEELHRQYLMMPFRSIAGWCVPFQAMEEWRDVEQSL
jgi:hypothetical protein